MSKVLIIIIAIIVIVAAVMVVKQFQGVKFGSLGSLFKVNYNVPSGLSDQKSNISYSTGGNAPVPVTSKPVPTPPAGFTVAQLSPYYGEVTIGNVSAGTYNGVSQFSLNAAYGGTQAPIDVTGWRFVSNKGEVIIPKAIADYTPGGAGFPGDVTLGPGQTLNVWSSVSPIVQNLRLNACAGYLNDTYTFVPSLPQNCTAAYDRSAIETFSGPCQNYILSLWGCSLPSASRINSFSGEPACQSFLNTKFGYSACYYANRFKPDFFSNTWDAWIGAPIIIDPSHDRLLLWDKQGLLVNEYVY